jgi:hypothetical protein
MSVVEIVEALVQEPVYLARPVDTTAATTATALKTKPLRIGNVSIGDARQHLSRAVR